MIRSPATHALHHPDRPLCRVRVHAARAHWRARAGARRRAGRRHPDAAPHEPDGRRHGARHPAGRGNRISGLRAQSVRHDARRPRRRLRHRARGGAGRARDRIEGGRVARRVLPDLARRRRHHRVGEGHQYRSPALPVRHRARARQSGADPDRRQCDHHAVRAGADLPSAGAGMRRPRLSAVGEPGRRAVASRLPGARGDQSRQRLPCARHAARGRHHDGAGGDRAVLGARHHRHDRDRGRERLRRELCGPAALVPRQRAVGSRHHPGGRRALCRVGAVRTGRRACSGSSFRGATWKREFIRSAFAKSEEMLRWRKHADEIRHRCGVCGARCRDARGRAGQDARSSRRSRSSPTW